jgi:hypothetical protein
MNNWEAFDVTLTSGQAGTYEIRVGYDTTLSGCSGDPNHEASRIAFVRGPGASF